MSLILIITIFFIWRSVDFLIAYLAPNFIPYLGHFSYVTDLLKSKLPQFIYSWTNFDGMFMLRISQKGYQEFEQAFFPLYPLIIRFIYQLTHLDRIIIGLLISNLAFIAGLHLLTKYFNKQKNIHWLILFILAFPTSYYFGALYTESLFFLLVIASLFFLKKDNWLLVFIFSFLASLTRLQGILLLIPLGIKLIPGLKNTINKSRDLNKLLTLLGPILGIGCYMIFLGYRFGQPLMFLTSHRVFGQSRVNRFIPLPQVYYRYLKIIITANHDFAYYRAIFEVVSFTIVAAVLFYLLYQLYKKGKILSSQSGLVLFSIAYLLMPTVSGTFLSMPRMVIIALPFFLFLADIKNRNLKILILLIFYLLHIITLEYFIQGYFIS